MVFWISAAALALAATGFIALAVLRRRDDAEHPAAFDLQVYRDQLKEVDKDLARGVINATDADRARTEISRRILAADAQLQAAKGQGTSKARGGVPLIAGLCIVLVGASFFAYSQLGAPGYDDQPLNLRLEASRERLDNRKSQAAAEADVPAAPGPTPGPDFVALMEKLRASVAERPDDLQGYELLARNEASLGNMQAAYEAQANVIRLKGDSVTATDYSIHANMLIAAADGYVSPKAQESLRSALEIDPINNLARYYWGLMLLQNDRPDLTFRIWDRVLTQSPPDAPWVPAIRARITDLAWFAGVDYQLPAPPHSDGLTGPDSDDVTAADEMSEEDRQDMIRGMVSNLAERLATEGGTPQEWARLLVAYGVLGDTERAAVIWEEAQQVFADVPDALEIVRDGARSAGVAN
ncbi:c-type cytochrome biogenesis protein CcmI [Shimia sp.]|uniref:c-type cytochrome biogenesis protein CcmI n=1 Tax=Shimia sp. TaxID=1954381 RepID=UPI0032984883